jgi:hypothetical protein
MYAPTLVLLIPSASAVFRMLNFSSRLNRSTSLIFSTSVRFLGMYYPPLGLVQKPAEVIKTRGKCVLFWAPQKVSVFSKNHCPPTSSRGCPLSARNTVRFRQESVSVFNKNCCPFCSGMSVRFWHEYA